MGPTWGPAGTDRAQVGPTLAPWTLLSGMLLCETNLSTDEDQTWLENLKDVKQPVLVNLYVAFLPSTAKQIRT